MNLKLKRLVRTNSSEQYALFDLDQSDDDEQPLTIGKVDLHYTGEGVYGTLLLWDETTRQLHPAQRRAFVNAILDEIIQPMGVPNEYVVEFFMPMLDHYELFHNVGIEEDEEDNADDDDQALDEVCADNRRQAAAHGVEHANREDHGHAPGVGNARQRIEQYAARHRHADPRNACRSRRDDFRQPQPVQG